MVGAAAAGHDRRGDGGPAPGAFGVFGQGGWGGASGAGGTSDPPPPPPAQVELTLSEGVVWVFSERLTGEGEPIRRLTPGVALLPLHDGLGCVSLIWAPKDDLLDGEAQSLLNQGPDCAARRKSEWSRALGAAPSLVEVRAPEATLRLPIDGASSGAEIVQLRLRW